MFRKIVSSALVTTVVSVPAIYVLVQQLHASTPAVLITVIAVLLLVSSGLSAWLSIRPARTQSRLASVASTSSVKRETGQVKWFNASKGFGFITRDNGEDIFVHFRSIRGEGHRVLKDGQRVEFSVSTGDKGLQADDVTAVSR
jgi:cold shock protein